MIAARASNEVIGRDGDLPWRLPEDLRWFKQQTLNKPVIMGRKTFESLGRPLPKRRNIVLTRDDAWHHEGAEKVGGLIEALALVADADEAMIIGGATIYEQVLPIADRLILTDVDRPYEGDAVFPTVDLATYTLGFEEPHPQSDPPFTFRIWDRRVST